MFDKLKNHIANNNKKNTKRRLFIFTIHFEMKNIKVIFSLLFVSLVFGVWLLAYMYFQVNTHLQILEKTKPMITKIYHNIEQDNPYNTNIWPWSLISADNLQSKVINAIKTTNPSVVNILISKNIKYLLQDPFSFRWKWKIINRKTQVGWWSGIMISKDGLIITNRHVVQDVKANYAVILNDWTIYQASQVRFDPLIDLAILQIVDKNWQKPTNLIPASFQKFEKNVNVWQFVLAIGNALAEYQNSATLWIISATNRQLELGQQNNLYIWLYQTDTPINPGNSGWPLIDIDGKVLWITTAINTDAEWIWFALPINQDFIDSTVLSITQHNSIKRPFLWVGYIDINKQISTKNNFTVLEWALVTEVIAWSSASLSWIEKWDVIIAINGNKITKQIPFLYSIYRFSPLEEVEITIIRNWKTYKTRIKLWMM